MESRTEHPSRRFTEQTPLVHRAVARRGYRPAKVTGRVVVGRPAETPASHLPEAHTPEPHLAERTAA